MVHPLYLLCMLPTEWLLSYILATREQHEHGFPYQSSADCFPLYNHVYLCSSCFPNYLMHISSLCFCVTLSPNSTNASNESGSFVLIIIPDEQSIHTSSFADRQFVLLLFLCQCSHCNMIIDH